MNGLKSKKFIIVALYLLIVGFLMWQGIDAEKYALVTSSVLLGYLGYDVIDKKTRNGG